MKVFIKCITVLLVSGLGFFPVFSQTWDNGGAGTNWQTADNWDNNTVPVAGDNVVIDCGTCTVTSNADILHDGDLYIGTNVGSSKAIAFSFLKKRNK